MQSLFDKRSRCSVASAVITRLPCLWACKAMLEAGAERRGGRTNKEQLKCNTLLSGSNYSTVGRGPERATGLFVMGLDLTRLPVCFNEPCSLGGNKLS